MRRQQNKRVRKEIENPETRFITGNKKYCYTWENGLKIRYYIRFLRKRNTEKDL